MAINGFFKEWRFLSNFHICPIAYEGGQYNSVEAAYQATKTTNPARRVPFQGDVAPSLARKMGQTLPIRTDWEEIKLKVMEDLCCIKFADPVLGRWLFDTGNEELVENCWWHDNFWGSCTCDRCGNKGQNHLGKILMKIREGMKYDYLRWAKS